MGKAKKKGGKVELLKEMMGEQLGRQLEEALLTALQCRLHRLSVAPCCHGDKGALFAQLDAELAKVPPNDTPAGRCSQPEPARKLSL